MTLDILHGDQLILLEASIEELTQAVRGVEIWTERHVEVLDDVYRGRVAQLLTRRGSLEELRDLHQHLSQASGLLRSEKSLSVPWSERWNSYAAVVSAQIGALYSQDPQGVRGRAHVEDILKVVRRGGALGVPQSAILDELKLQKANLARILNLMEANDLIERRPSPVNKREKHVLLGRNAGLAIEGRSPSDGNAPSPGGRRGLAYLIPGAA